MAGPKKTEPATRGAELTDEVLRLPSPGVDTPIATASGFDLSRDMDEQVRERQDQPDPVFTEPLTTPYRRLRAIHYGAGAAAALAAYNLVSLVDFDKRPLNSLVGADPLRWIAAHIGAAVIALGLAAIIFWRRSAIACFVVVGWCLVEAIPPLPRYFYGHLVEGRAWQGAVALVGLALVGLRGAWAEQDAEAKAHEATPSPAPPSSRP